MLIPLKLPPIPLSRTIKPGQVDRYVVESEWRGGENAATYRYDMTLQAARYLEKKPEFVEATARMEHLRMTRNGEALPQVRLAGVFGIKWQGSGGPLELVAGGPAATLGVPLLGWYLPESVGPDGRFLVTHQQVDTNVFADGWGRLTSLAGKTARFTYELALGPSDVPQEARAVRFRAISVVRLDTGRVLSCEGELVDPGGTLNFRIRHR